MTDDPFDATIRSIADRGGELDFGLPPLAPAVLARVHAARGQDRSWLGRRVRDLGFVPFGRGTRSGFRGRPQLAFAALLVIGAGVVGAIAAGARLTVPSPTVGPEGPSVGVVIPGSSSPSPSNPSRSTSIPSNPSLSGFLVVSSNGRIVVVRGDGSGRRELTSGSVADSFPMWSPDGSRIAFVSQECSPSETCPDKVAPSDLVVMDADGSGRRILRSGLRNAEIPRWSADGSAIVIQSYSDPSETLEVGLDGQVRRLDGLPTELDPAWVSPDGSRVLELGGDPGDSAIRIRDLGTGGSVRLVAVDATESRLSIIGWMPDGTSVLYYVIGRGITHPTAAWIVAGDGSNPRPWDAYPEHSRVFGWSADRAWLLIHDTTRYIVARGDGSAPREIDGVEMLEWSRDHRVLLGTAGALDDIHHVGGRVLVIDPSGSGPPVQIETPGQLGMDWWSER